LNEKDKEVINMNPLEENLKLWNDLCNFFKQLDDEQVEMFIKYGKENVENFGDEKNWGDVIHKIKSRN
jgi:hypothetical protein